MKVLPKCLCLFLLFLVLSTAVGEDKKLNSSQILTAVTSSPLQNIVGKVYHFFRNLVSGSRTKSVNGGNNSTGNATNIMRRNYHHHNYYSHYSSPFSGFTWLDRFFNFNFGSNFNNNWDDCNCDDCNCDDCNWDDCNCDDCWKPRPSTTPRPTTSRPDVTTGRPSVTTTGRPAVGAVTSKPGVTTARPAFLGKLPTCHCDCGKANHAPLPKIVGGTTIRPNEYPWLARIDYRSKFHCGGSLINKDYVLTAAHCVENRIRSGFRIVLGDHNRMSSSSVTESRGVSEIVSHHRYNDRNMHNDIALMRLNKPVEFTLVIRPVCQPDKDMAFGGKTGTVVGWGTTSEQGEASQFPLQADVPVYSHVQCRRFNYRPSEISSKMICAGGDTKDTCQGDSGGPLQLRNDEGKYVLAGVVSWGNGCGRRGYPGVYTNAAKYQDWILENMRDTCVCIS